ncbi:hypothetical protein FRC01_014196 [Tulasnella sp. 417]|nr:hypothetical protein FRC01_014196 [Tulasnella sp. 417]
MQTLFGKVLEAVQDLLQIRTLQAQPPTINESTEGNQETRSKIGDVARLSERPIKLSRVKPYSSLNLMPSALTQSLQRQKLNDLSSLRIHPTELEFPSGSAYSSGGKGDVTKATHRRGNNADDEQVVAVKKLRYHRDRKRKKFGNEFVHEVEVMAKLSHENIVRLIGFVEDLKNGTAWIVMSLESNGNVGEFLKKGEFEMRERVSLIQDIFEGVKYLHTRKPPICHGDLKSFNILVNSGYRAVITDFGSAREISAPEDEGMGEESGPQMQGPSIPQQDCDPIHIDTAGNKLTLTGPAWSLRWAAPEVMNGRRPGLSSDIWAAGWVCWEVGDHERSIDSTRFLWVAERIDESSGR